MGQFPSRLQIVQQQLEQLNLLLAEVGKGNHFYQQKLGANCGPFANLAEYRRRVPFTTKGEIVHDQEAHPRFGTNLSYPIEAYSRFHQTSGTSGAPLRWLDTNESWSALIDGWVEVFRAAGATQKDRIYFAFSFGPFLGFWLAFEAGTRLNALCIPGGGLSSSARLKAIVENEATIICCTPTYALRLGEVAVNEKLDMSQSKVRLLMVAGEPGGSIPSVRQRLEQLWPRARVFDHHGMTEVGPVTYECPDEPGVLHVNELAYLPEVIDLATGDFVPPGETGELVLTTLTRLGSPLLRYRTGDLVRLPARWDQHSPEAQPTCRCGRSYLRLEGGILGRTDDMVVIRGVNVYPSAVDAIVRKFPEVVEYQAAVKMVGSMPELEVTIEPGPASSHPETLRARLEDAFKESLSLRVPVHLAEPGSLPRFEMKAKRWRKGL
jgi:phenylacetate-CoA ligase